jgi:hypothetical protein
MLTCEVQIGCDGRMSGAKSAETEAEDLLMGGTRHQAQTQSSLRSSEGPCWDPEALAVLGHRLVFQATDDERRMDRVRIASFPYHALPAVS